MPSEPEPTPRGPSASSDRPAARKAAAPRKPSPTARRIAQLEEQLEAALGAERSAARRADELATVARLQSSMADELHAENRRLRDGEIREAVAPLVRGLARLADELGGLRAATAEPGNAPTPADLAHLDARVHELLHDAGVIPLRPAAGDPFDVRLHEAAGSVDTDDPLSDRTVQVVRRPGLIRDDGRILRPATVVVHRFAHPTPKDPS